MIERLAERDDVAARHHRDRDPERVAAHVAHAWLGRIAEAAAHRGDVAEAEEPAVGADRERLHAFHRIERAARAHVDAIGGRLEAAGRGDRVLLGEGGEDRGRLDAERAQARVGHLDVDLLVLLADQIHLADVLHAQELVADAVGRLLELRVRIAVAGDRVDVAEGVAELVVEKRPDHARGKRRADVADLLADLVPRVANLVGPRRILHEDEHHGLAGLGVAAQEIEARRFLELLLDLVGELALDLVGRGARPERAHHHQLEGEIRVLGLAEPQERADADRGEHYHEIEEERRVRQRPLGQVEAPDHGYRLGTRLRDCARYRPPAGPARGARPARAAACARPR